MNARKDGEVRGQCSEMEKGQEACFLNSGTWMTLHESFNPLRFTFLYLQSQEIETFEL